MNDPTYMLPGIKPVLEILRASPERVKQIILKPECHACAKIANLAEAMRIPVEYADEHRLDRLCANKTGIQTSHQGAIAILAPAPLDLATLLAAQAPTRLLIALDQVQDPGNLGTIARTAWAMGCMGLILPEHNSASPGPAAMRSSAGALALLPFCQAPNLARALDQAEEAGFAILCAACGNAQPASDAFHFDWQLPAVLVLGGENKGIRPGVIKRCHHILEIPLLRQFDSLNVAQAGAMLIALCVAQTKTCP